MDIILSVNSRTLNLESKSKHDFHLLAKNKTKDSQQPLKLSLRRFIYQKNKFHHNSEITVIDDQ